MVLTQLITLFLLQTQDSPKTCTMLPEAIFQTFLVLWQVGVTSTSLGSMFHCTTILRVKKLIKKIDQTPQDSGKRFQTLETVPVPIWQDSAQPKAEVGQQCLGELAQDKQKLIARAPGNRVWAVAASILVALAVSQVATWGYDAVDVEGPVCPQQNRQLWTALTTLPFRKSLTIIYCRELCWTCVAQVHCISPRTNSLHH